ncbi:hypothetical protein CMV_024716 [Castanea mollissima]|uniref:Uncharacterized protein n=1 Tax=Castanea mollissima TaxID=60419 RepID=A0A8J4VHP2_9ROSI|nr:hypothetical protein CMV_024716 [Castanea mollissima]
MRRSYGYQQQSYEMQEVQQQSYAMNQQEAWKSQNQYRNQYSDMEIVPSAYIDSQLLRRQNNFNGKQGLHQNGWMGQEVLQNGWNGQGMGQNGWNETSAYSNSSHVPGGNRLPRGNGFKAGSQFSQGVMLNNEMEEDFEYETFNQVQAAPSTVRVQEMRYAHSSWGDNGHPRRRNMVMLNGNGCWRV